MTDVDEMDITPAEAEALCGILLERFAIPEGYTGSKEFHFKRGRYQTVRGIHTRTRTEIDGAVEEGRLQRLVSALTHGAG